MTNPALPIIDLSKLDEGPEAAAVLREQLLTAAHDVGFFYLSGHGIAPELFDQVLANSRAFFELPEHQKLEIENVKSPQFRGYTRIGGELTNGKVDWREQIDIGVERPAVAGAEDVPDYYRLEGPNQWPAELPKFREAFEQWQQQLSAVALKLLRSLAEALGAPADVFDDAFTDSFAVIKVVRYPGKADRVQGVGEHRDGGVLTLLLVEPDKGGLQVERDGNWVDAPTIPGTFIVNIGEMLELATAGYLKATLHRVIAPEQGTDRVSIPFFFNPALNTVIPTLKLPADLATAATGVTADPTDSPILQTYGDNALRYRLRAHPDVAERHHQDLLAAAASTN